MSRRMRSSRPARTDLGAYPDEVVKIEKVVAEGDGLAHLHDGRVVFVEGGLPGETVRARLVRQSRDYARAVVVEVIEAHSERVEPPCPYVIKGCGGCDLQHASLALQQQIKRDIVIESLVRIGKIADPAVISHGVFVGLEPRAKRTTVRVIGDQSGRPGFRRSKSHDVVAIKRCEISHDGINEILADLRLDPGHEAVVRVGDASGERVVWTDPSTQITTVIQSDDVGTIYGESGTIRENVSGIEFKVSASSFFQSSPVAAEELVDAMHVALGDPSGWPVGPVVDAYGGVGLFTAMVIPPDREAILIEVSESSCRDAAVNLRGRLARVVQSPFESWTPEPAAVVIADPPRDGLRAQGVDNVAATGAAVVVLVSCDPASLGRDARLLENAGYRFVQAIVVGAFPHTHHVEAVSRFEKCE